MLNSSHFTVPEIYAPPHILTNDELARIVDTNDKWIVERTGIRRRRQMAQDQEASSLGLNAAKAALARGGFNPDELTHVITATCTPDYLSPSVACVIAGQLTTKPVMAFDVGAACAGFIYGASLCRSLCAADKTAKILFICAEALTRRVNWGDRSTCVLFGDGAAACLVSAAAWEKSFSISDIICQSDGSLKDLIIVGGGTSSRYQPGDPVGGDFFITMHGRDTYRHAVRQMVDVCRALLTRNHLGITDIDLLVPHQANLRIIEAVGSRLKIPAEKVFTNVADYGNTSAASIPVALSEACAQGKIKQGDLVLVTAFGAGLTWGAALLQF